MIIMNKKICKIIIIVTIILAIIIGVMYLIDLNTMHKFDTLESKYASIELNTVNENAINLNTNNTENYQKYSKLIDNTKIELNIPNEWNYEEIAKDKKDDSYKYALKLYKTTEKQYATLYLYKNKFGVCGTGRTTENIILNNGNKADIGYYNESKNWSDISFYKTNANIAVLNHGLENDEATELIEIIKTINITNK